MPQNVPQFGTPVTEPPKQTLPPRGMDPQKKNLLMFLAIFTALAVLTGLVLVLIPQENSNNNTFVDPLAEQKTNDDMSTSTETSEITPDTSEKTGFFALLERLFSPQKTKSSTTGSSGTTSGTTSRSGMFTLGKTNMFNLGPTTMFSTRTSGNVRTRTSGDYLATTTLEYRNTSTEAEQQAYLRQLEAIEKGVDAAEYRASELELIARSSPLRGTISISSVRKSSNNSPDTEYITLTGNRGLPYDTPLTGMTLRSLSSGQVVTIGEGVRLPITNELPYKETVYINPGTRVYVVTGKSPLGYSFRVNKCTGYLTQFQRFTPAIALRCPRLNTEELPKPPNQLSDACLDYINRVSQCRIVTNLSLTTTEDQSYDCYKFIVDHTGYNNCVNLHRYDSDFYQNEWRIYLGRTQTAWKSKREIIWLEDQSGRFINYYSY